MSMTMGMSIIMRLSDCSDGMGHAPGAYIWLHLPTQSMHAPHSLVSTSLSEYRAMLCIFSCRLVCLHESFFCPFTSAATTEELPWFLLLHCFLWLKRLLSFLACSWPCPFLLLLLRSIWPSCCSCLLLLLTRESAAMLPNFPKVLCQPS